MDFLQGSLNLFCKELENLTYVVPNVPVLLQGPLPASSLKLVKLSQWPSGVNVTLNEAGHFVATDINNFDGDFPLEKATLASWYKEIMKGVDSTFAESVRIEVLTCVREIYKNLMKLRGRHATNEAEVRFTYANPIVNMLCGIHGLFLGVEHKMATPGGFANATNERSFQAYSLGCADQVSEKSSSDFICYTLHQQYEGSHIKLVVVIVEVKTNASFHINAVAQLLGYYLRSCTDKDEHMVGLLITESKVHLLLFPFIFNDDVACVNAIWLSSIEYSDNDTWNTITMLSLLAMVTRKDFYDTRLCPVTKDHQFKIKNEIETIRDELKKELTDLKEERSQLEAEKRALKAKEQDVKAKEQDVKAKEQDVKAKEQDVKAKEQDLKAKEQDVKAKEQDVKAKEQDVKAKEQDVKAKEQDVDALVSKCKAFEVAIKNYLEKKLPP